MYRQWLTLMVLSTSMFTIPAYSDQTACVLTIPHHKVKTRRVAEVSSQLINQLNQTPGITAWTASMPVERQLKKKACERVRMLHSQANKMYRKFECTQALDLLEHARDILIHGKCTNVDLLHSQFLYQGIINFVAQKQEQVLLDFKYLSALDPTWKPDRFTMAPKIRAVFERAKNELLRESRVVIDVQGLPINARVLLDGQHVGYTHTVLTNVLPGIHYLEVASPGYVTHFEQIEVKQGEQVDIRIVLFTNEAFSQFKQGNFFRFAQEFTTDFVVLVGVTPTQVRVEVLSTKDDWTSSPIYCSWDSSDKTQVPDLIACLHAGCLTSIKSARLESKKYLAEQLSKPELFKQTEQGIPKSVSQRAWYKRGWVWAVAGGVLASAAVGIGVSIFVSSDNKDYQVVVTRP